MRILLKSILFFFISGVLAIVHAEGGVITIPMNFPTIQNSVCIPFITPCGGGKTTVTVSQSGSYNATPPVGYKFCGYKTYTSSANPSSANLYINNSLNSDGSATFGFNIPCGGGGISLSTVGSIGPTIVGSLLILATGGIGDAAFSNLIFGSTDWTALNVAIAAGNSAISSVTSAAVSALVPISYGQSNCGVGDAGNWLYGGIAIEYTSSYLSCPTAPGTTTFSNIQPNIPNPALSSIINFLLSDPITSTTAVTSSLNSIGAGQSVTFSATVNGSTPTGTVQFMNGSVALGSPVTLVGGVATLTTTALTGTGSNLITAVYSGDTNNLTSTSSAFSEIVLVYSSISVTPSAASIAAGQSITFTATVTGSNPTGTIQFFVNSAALGGPITLINGVATLTTTGLNVVGSDSITASYSGDANNAANTSQTPLIETVVATQTQVPALPWFYQLLMALVLIGSGFWSKRKSR